MRALLAVAALLACAFAQPVQPPKPAAPKSGTYELPLRTLVLTTQSVLSDYPRWIMNAMQQPFDLYQLVDEGANEVNAYASQIGEFLVRDGAPQYNSIVLETAFLGYQTANNTFVSALSDDQWKAISNYCKKYKARKVFLASSPVVDTKNIKPYPGWEQGSSADVNLAFVDNDVAKAVHNNVKLNATWRLGQVTEFTRTSYWYYPATLTSNHDGSIKPFMTLNPIVAKPEDCSPATLHARKITLGNGVVTDPCTWTDPDWIGAFLRVLPDGEEEMHFLVNQNLFDHHSFSVADIWFTWVTRGIWPGMRRVPLSAQIDDVFLSTGTYNTTLNRQSVSPLEPSFRSGASDLEELKEWQDAFNARLPEGSRVVIELAFNGLGYFAFAGGKNDINKALGKLRDNFFWVSHTWSHMDLYCPNSDCKDFGYTKYNDTRFELMKNHWMAYNYIFRDIPDERLNTSSWPTWSENSLVTPRISGLNLSDSIRAMRDSGIDFAVGDNSRADLAPTNIWHPFQTRVNDGTPEKRTVNVIPRFATRVYFDCATEEQNSMEHNSIYGPNCLGNSEEGPAVLPIKCNRTTFKYPRDLSMSEIFAIEGFEVARNLLSYRTDPYMFHQANLNFHDTPVGRQCLLTWWIKSVTDYFIKYSSLPLFTLKMADMENFYVERMKRDNCGIAAAIQYEGGKPKNLVMRSKSNCVAKLSFTMGNTLQFADAYQYEQYGPDRTRDIPLRAGEDTIIPIGKPEVEPTQKPYLPYPPVPASMLAEIDFLRNLSQFDQWEADFIQELAVLEKKLQSELQSELDLFVPQFADYVEKLGKCRTDANDKYAEKVYAQFDQVSKPTDEAIKLGESSWYRQMEDSLIALGAKYIKAGGAFATGDMMQEMKDAVSQHLTSTQDRMEDYGTKVNHMAFASMKQSSKVLDDLKYC